MRAVVPTYIIDADDPVTVQHHASGRCALRIGDGSLIFDSAAEAEAAVDEWALALRLAHVGGVATPVERGDAVIIHGEAFAAWEVPGL